MSKSLIITEKPSVARDIAKVLGGFSESEGHLESDQYVMSWAVGHVLEFSEPEDIDPRYKAWKLDDLPIIPDPFVFKPKSGQVKLVRHLEKLIKRKDVHTVINACDAGREGELIFREILEWVGVDKPTLRLWLQSMTPESIRKAFTQLRDGREFDRLGAAAHCRSEADWLIGINGTRALTRRMKLRSENSAWSVGRVQTPTLAMLVDRELEILKHRPQPFWRVVGTFAAQDHEYVGTWFDPRFKADPDSPRKDDWVTDPQQLDAILAAVQGKPGTAQETRKRSSEIAPPLFDLTSLQREANRRLGYSARRTLAAAQRLYEGLKLITYPRTDSRCLPNDYVGHVHQVLDLMSTTGPYRAAARNLKQRGLQNQGRNFDDSRVSDHFAIIPTTEMPSGALTGDDARVYDLVVRRFLASFHPPATWIKVERTTEVPEEGTATVHSFRTRSRYLSDPGWYEVYGRDVEDDGALPPLERRAGAGGDEGISPRVGVANREVHAEDDETRPPARITEARLLSLMEHAGKQVDDDNLAQILGDKGLGTPATRAEIIENLVLKQYALRAERSLRATPKAILLIDLLKRIDVRRLASPELTGEVEKHLREVEGGERTRDIFMREIQDYTRDIVDHAKGFDYDDIYSHQPAVGDCPVCKTRKVYEKARLYACEGNVGRNLGDCPFSLWKEKGGRYLDRFTVTELLEGSQTPPLEGFLTLRGEGYRAALRVTPDGTVEILGDKGGPAQSVPEMPVNADPLGPCPFDPRCEIIETPTHYQCRGVCVQNDPKRKGGAQMPREVCKRTISRDEACKLFVEGRTDLFDDFVSRFGKNFKAFLYLQDTGRHGFLFPPREPRKKASPGTKGEDAEGAAGRSPRGRSPRGRKSVTRKAAPATAK